MSTDSPTSGIGEKLLPSPKREIPGYLAVGVVHDLKDMLILINGYCDLLIHDQAASPEQAGFLKEIYSAGERASMLVNQLLNLRSRPTLSPQAVDVSEVVVRMTGLLHSLVGEKVLLQVESSKVLPMVLADTASIGQIVLNLAINARNAMPSGGRLTITTAVRIIDKEGSDFPIGASTGQFVCLCVEDNGCGISPQVVSRIVDPCFTMGEVGEEIGLGLMAVRGIVRQHGGWIQVERKPEAGTSFMVFLPLSLASPVVSAIESNEMMITGGKETILLVEDEPAVRALAALILQKYGYRVLEAANAEEAMEVWKRHGHRTSLLFTDLVMTGEMTGRELAERLQSDKPALKVIYTSGYSVETGTHLFELKAGNSFIQKPYQPRTLAQTVRQTLDESQKQEH